MAQNMPQPWKHPKSGVYYYRKAVPKHLRATLGRGEFRISLGTKDLREAKLLYPATAAKVDALIAQAGGGPTILDHQQIYALAGLWYQRELEATEANPEEPENYSIYLDHLQDADERGKGREAVSADVDAILTAEGLVVIAQPCREQLADRIFWHRVRLYNTLTRRAVGDYSPDPELSKFPAWIPPSEAAPKALQGAPGSTLVGLLTAWATERKPRARTADEWRLVIDRLAAHVGHSDPSKLTKGNMVAWKDALLAEGKAPKTVSNHLLILNALFNWAMKNDRLSANPVQGVTVAAKREGGKARLPYGDADAMLILNAARQLKGARRWVPWLLAYTGARREEVCQALAKDTAAEAPR